MEISVTQLFVNAGLLLVLITMLVIMMRLGTRFDYNYGISEIQGPIKRNMVYLIFGVIVISLAGAVYNLYVTFG